MVFSSGEFLFLFLPLFLVAYVLAGAWRNGVLLAASIFFYFVGEGWFVLLMLFSILANYIFGLLIARANDRRRSFWLTLGIAINIGALIYYKYAGFLASSVFHLPNATAFEGIHLPLGISFFTFQAISYLVDVHRGDAAAEKSIFRLGSYISMFPQLVAGPIVRFSTVAIALRQRTVRLRHAYYGLIFFAVGLAEKVLLADSAAGIADAIYATQVADLSRGAAWLGGFAYSLQIFFDFSGYSAMAIGLGFLIGFRFPQNFNFPYTSVSITDFWRRWHISLSSWFRDYVYIPLGGNRHGAIGTYRNLFLVFLLTGVWHGASWNFVFWGLYHGAFLILERIGFGRVLKKTSPIIQVLYTLLVVYFGWVFFRADDLPHAFSMISQMFVGRADGTPAAAFINHESVITLCLGVICATPILLVVSRRFMAAPDMDGWRRASPASSYAVGIVVALLLIAASAIKILAGSYSPFIYFRF